MIDTPRALACAAALACLLIGPSRAENARENLAITQAWSRATPGGAKVAAGYLTIENKGASAERLLSASSSLAGKIEIHEMAIDRGVMTMRPIDGGLVIAAGSSAKFAPGGTHLMLVGLAAPLRQGEHVPVTLKFENAGEIGVFLDVQGVGAQAPAAENRPQAPQPAPAAAAAESEESFFTHLHAVRAMANVTVSPGRAGPVEIAIQLEDADERPLAAESVSVSLGQEHGIAPVTASAERVGADQWRVRMSAPTPGRWSLALHIAISPTDAVNVTSPILLR
jgi:copper(I)-binding protein